MSVAPRPQPTGPARAVRDALENAPLDDEPYTDEERAADAEALEDMKRGNGVSMAEKSAPSRPVEGPPPRLP